jgi:hypothetical protein
LGPAEQAQAIYAGHAVRPTAPLHRSTPPHHLGRAIRATSKSTKMHQSTSRIRRGGFGGVEEVYGHAGSAEVS